MCVSMGTQKSVSHPISADPRLRVVAKDPALITAQCSQLIKQCTDGADCRTYPDKVTSITISPLVAQSVFSCGLCLWACSLALLWAEWQTGSGATTPVSWVMLTGSLSSFAPVPTVNCPYQPVIGR